jgi:hypothetical protein
MGTLRTGQTYDIHHQIAALSAKISKTALLQRLFDVVCVSEIGVNGARQRTWKNSSTQSVTRTNKGNSEFVITTAASARRLPGKTTALSN